jgi:uncharacterized protein (TIGR00369 family)
MKTHNIDPEHFRKLEHMYKYGPINKAFNPTVCITEGAAEVTIPIKKDFYHAANSVHGMVYFKALDDATFFAANSLVTDVFILTASFNINLLRPVIEGEFTSKARVVHASRQLIIADGELFNEGRLVARGSGTFMRSNIPLTAELGYK